MDLDTLLLFIITETLLSLTPGPAVLLVLGLSVRHGFKIGFGATLGIITTNAVYFSLAALGVGALVLASSALFTLIKWAGAAYLAYLGFHMLKPVMKSLRARRTQEIPCIDVAQASRAVRNDAKNFRQSFIRGFTLQASNPKNIAFFVAILPQFVVPGENMGQQLVILGVVSVLLELPILMFYGLASAKSAALMKERVIEWIEGVAGCLLIFMGGALALYKR